MAREQTPIQCCCSAILMLMVISVFNPPTELQRCNQATRIQQLRDAELQTANATFALAQRGLEQLPPNSSEITSFRRRVQQANQTVQQAAERAQQAADIALRECKKKV
jgi:hypothetical protein